MLQRAAPLLSKHDENTTKAAPPQCIPLPAVVVVVVVVVEDVVAVQCFGIGDSVTLDT